MLGLRKCPRNFSYRVVKSNMAAQYIITARKTAAVTLF